MDGNRRPERAKPFFANPSRYVRNNPYIELRSRAVRQILPPRERRSVLDLGCGDGRVSIPMVRENDDLLLVDSSPRMLDLALSNVPREVAARVRGQCADVAAFAPDRTFDVVLCLGVLAHLDDWVAGLKIIERCLAPDGYAVIQLTDQGRYLGRLTRKVGDLNRRFFEHELHSMNTMTLAGVKDELSGIGLSLISMRRYVLLYGLRFAPPRLARALVGLASRSPIADRGGEVLALVARGARA